MLATNPPAAVAAYGADYFTFSVIGFALAESMWTCLRSFSMGIRYQQIVGTLEAMMATPARTHSILLYSGIYPLAFAALRLAVVVAAAVAFGAGFEFVPLLRAMPVLLLTLAVFGGFGMLSASVTLVIKKGDPVAAFFGAASFLLGGALYPVSSLPGSLRVLSEALPITHAIEACRRVILLDCGLGEVVRELVILAGFALGAGVLAWLAVRWAVRLARAGGVRHY